MGPPIKLKIKSILDEEDQAIQGVKIENEPWIYF